ncbi:acetyl-CoA carboxylase biotin carboxyl carrier protein subunit [uncultured Prevotella sp.]|uniref:biotin/lipoyl-containing protein n=1 Tax=uncultured Prevotella sp. TaxID=159272 RepID=UPI00261127B8|nr:acetyl-CoA carboxylase biotin carboxyl carrier protein subunit [uncultured Prevotella sp.]
MNKYQYKVQGVDYDVEIVDVEGNIAKVSVNGIPFEVELKEPIKASHMPKRPVVKPAAAPAAAAPVAAAPKAEKPAAAAGAGTKIKAPLPGTITEMKVKVGDTVKNGDTVVVLEAMKMQNNIEAECGGTVTSVLVNPGDTVMEGDTLITIG